MIFRKNFRNILLLILAACYRAAYMLHHKFFLKQKTPLINTKLVVVGSFLAGGAGKTPFCMALANSLKNQGEKVAILCHKKAYDEVKMMEKFFYENNSDFTFPQKLFLKKWITITFEISHLIKLKDSLNFSTKKDDVNVKIFATNNRYKTALELDAQKKFSVILCDDGFEDSRLIANNTFLLLWETPPQKIQDLIPLGKCRSLWNDHFSFDLKKFCGSKNLPNDYNNLSIVFCRNSTKSTMPQNFENKNLGLICGLGNPKRFIDDLKNYGLNIPLKYQIILKDHQKKFEKILLKILKKHPHIYFIISEKDAARLSDDFIKNYGETFFIAKQKIITNF